MENISSPSAEALDTADLLLRHVKLKVEYNRLLSHAKNTVKTLAALARLFDDVIGNNGTRSDREIKGALRDYHRQLHGLKGVKPFRRCK